MAEPVVPLTSREALLFEQVAEISVLAALGHLTAGTTPAGACVAALLIVGRRNAADVTVDDVLDSHESFAELAEAGTTALQLLLDVGGDT